MSIILIRAIILYIVVILAIRLMGKRQLGELQPSELVITILVSNIATLALEDTSIPLMMGIIPIFILVTLDVIMSFITLKSRRVRKLVSGNPKIIIQNGTINQKQLKELRFSLDDVMESLREQSIFDINEVQFAIVETTGKISVYQKFGNQASTNNDNNIEGESKNPPQIIVDDGVLLEDSMNSVKKSKQWLAQVLNKEKIEISDIFMLSADECGGYNLIKKENIR